MKSTLNLFCLPYAGGNKYCYHEYIKRAPSFLHVRSLEYPGRGSRIKEPLVSDIDTLVNDLYHQVRTYLDQKDYAIYGHSMGGLLAYLLTKKIIDNNHRAPLHLFITGTTGPASSSRTEKKKYLLPPPEFINELKVFEGMPDEILQSKELLSYFEPILRADFKVTETYIHKEDEPLNVPITVITGSEEDMETSDIQLWQKVTTRVVSFKRMPGKHFFIFKYPNEIVEIISKKLFVHTHNHINYE